MGDEQLLNLLRDAVISAKEGKGDFIPVEYKDDAPRGKNQFLFFMKPELFESLARFDSIVKLVTDGFRKYDFSIERIAVLSSRYLARYGVVSEHYGVIDAVARDPQQSLSDQAKGTFRSEYGINAGDANLIGAVRYLEERPAISAEELSRAWLNRGYKKLGGGTYCQFLADENIYLINGFYPRLLQHFTTGASCIASFVIRSDTSWKVARREFIGVTEPAKAMPGSVRNQLLVQRESLDIEEVSPNLNGVHLSAGPVEGLVELRRFTTDFSGGKDSGGIGNFAFGGKLQEHFDDDQIVSILDNKTITRDGTEISIFDLTEELDADEAVDVLSNIANQLAKS